MKDYELYKDVMETAVVRLKGEMQRLVDEREAAKKAASRASAHARREREQANAARKRAKAAEGDLVQLQLSTEDQVSRVKASFRQKEVGGVATHGRDGDSWVVVLLIRPVCALRVTVVSRTSSSPCATKHWRTMSVCCESWSAHASAWLMLNGETLTSPASVVRVFGWGHA